MLVMQWLVFNQHLAIALYMKLRVVLGEMYMMDDKFNMKNMKDVSSLHYGHTNKTKNVFKY